MASPTLSRSGKKTLPHKYNADPHRVCFLVDMVNHLAAIRSHTNKTDRVQQIGRVVPLSYMAKTFVQVAMGDCRVEGRLWE
jgi:hypothetical protein